MSMLAERKEELGDLRAQVENEVRYANITIIEGNDASQYGIGIVATRIAEMILRDERSAIPIGSYQPDFGITLSLPSIVGRSGVTRVLQPDFSPEEQEGLRRSAENLRIALERIG
jgi:L-lactate dehydrogenase